MYYIQGSTHTRVGTFAASLWPRRHGGGGGTYSLVHLYRYPRGLIGIKRYQGQNIQVTA